MAGAAAGLETVADTPPAPAPAPVVVALVVVPDRGLLSEELYTGFVGNTGLPGEDAPPFAPTAPVLTGDLTGGAHFAARDAFACATAEYGTAAVLAAEVSTAGTVDTAGAGAGAGRGGGGADTGVAVAVAAVLFRERFARLAATAAAAAAACVKKAFDGSC